MLVLVLTVCSLNYLSGKDECETFIPETAVYHTVEGCENEHYNNHEIIDAYNSEDGNTWISPVQPALQGSGRTAATESWVDEAECVVSDNAGYVLKVPFYNNEDEE